ncbi:MAG: helix-hairpin-helix domain-containing protein [Pseudooceanicola sp.]
MSEETAPAPDAENAWIAARLRDYAELLDSQGADGFRSRAYRNAASRIETLTRPLRAIHESGGLDALIDLPDIGQGIARAVAEMLVTGRWSQLDRLTGDLTPEALFRTVPGIGPELARRLTDTLDVETLEELETALRLGTTPVPGIGPRRRQAILAALGARLSRMRRAEPTRTIIPEPPVGLLLDADALYRERAAAGTLRRIAPRRFNPGGEAWLPIMHARRDDWHLTLLYSNTARAHELARTRDWVVIYFHRDSGPEARRTVVTERNGPLSGLRVVRGREAECAEHYAATITPHADA